MAPSNIVTLTTDFGVADAYVAAMKGVILSINQHAQLVDVTHEVRPQQITQAVFLTQSAWSYFPEGAIHIAVVDPGVGTDRRALALATPRDVFVGPDNGVLSAALPEKTRAQAGESPAPVDVPQGYRAFEITNPTVLREPLSATFHGRDVFAPAAAHLSLGMAPEDLGNGVDSLVAIPPLRARRCDDRTLRARVIHIDRYGNVVTDARAEDLPEGGLAVELRGRTVHGPARTYADSSGPAALVASTGYLVVALTNGNAAVELGAEVGDEAIVRPAR